MVYLTDVRCSSSFWQRSTQAQPGRHNYARALWQYRGRWMDVLPLLSTRSAVA
uniref:Uncharacterized protein n=1 Tax=Arundo donax TaxID=35708 RepID=A0A0A9AQ27_ARUDO